MTWILFLTISTMRAMEIIDHPTSVAVYSQEFNSQESCEIAGKAFYEMNAKGTHRVHWLCAKK